MATYTTKFEMGDKVYLRLCREDLPGLITGVTFRSKYFVYHISWGHTHEESSHLEFELSPSFVRSFEGT